ncbi:DUF6778 family protein [Celeribacter sp. PS-C1]|uniref:DUF6778 family protein n=1 Tax=Celeribacter sp. PS-C1 TaxID=2820813 RepID=UPI001CA5291A|nr:DUF6778 family protein [Celeribacter sp. PS-C1]MBW6417336.1 hypothetical protein [Celeribacter sp. PS-C1]
MTVLNVQKSTKIAAALLIAVATSACTTQSTSHATSRAITLGGASAGAAMVAPDFRVTKVNVTVPETLTVSEANTIKPRADIVWREDPYGDRYARYEQVKAVMEAGLNSGAAALKGQRAIVLDVEMVRFHAQTERVRYSSLPSRHEIEFLLTVRDAQTGDVIVPSHLVNATFDAFGGDAAVAADRAGITQKQRIGEHLAGVILSELSKPIAL